MIARAIMAGVILLAMQATLPDIPVYEAQRIADRSITVDGSLDEAVWKAAPSLHLVFPWESQTGAKQNTTVKLLWDSVALYVGYECEDTDITAQYQNHDDPVYRDDAVEVYFNPHPEQGPHYIGLEMNVRAVLYDYLRIWPGPLVKQFELSGVQLASHIDGSVNMSGDQDKGWSLEVAIPWENFRSFTNDLIPKAGSEWRINVNRWDGTNPKRRLSQWSPSGLPTPDPHNPERFGRLRFK